MKICKVCYGLFSVVILSLALAALPACGGSGGGGGGDIVVTPGTAVVAKGATQQFVATQNSVDVTDDVDWSVSAGGGSFDGEPGLFSTPSSLPADNVVTITATSGDDSGTAEVTLKLGETRTFTDKSFYDTQGLNGASVLTQAIAYDESNHIIYVSFTDFSMTEPPDLFNYVYKSDDAGISFDDPAGNLTPESELNLFPQIVLGGDGLMSLAFYSPADDGGWSINTFSSDDGAVSFDSTVFPEPEYDVLGIPFMVADSDGWAAIAYTGHDREAEWDETRLMVSLKDAGAEAFTGVYEAGRFGGHSSLGIDQPSMAMDGDNMVVMYSQKQDDGDENIRDGKMAIWDRESTPEEVTFLEGLRNLSNFYLVIDSDGGYHIVFGFFQPDEGDELTGTIGVGYGYAADGISDGFTMDDFDNFVAVAAWPDVTMDRLGRLYENYRPTMVFDEVSGRVYIAYYLEDGLYVSSGVPSTAEGDWSSERLVMGGTVDFSGDPATFTSITSDSLGRIYVAGSVEVAGVYNLYFGIGE